MSASTPIAVDCKFLPRVMDPVFNSDRCEAKGPCVTACPYDVVAIRIVPVDVEGHSPYGSRA
jgi:ferredoxin